MQLRCLVERITYRSKQSGYSIIKTRVKGFIDLVPVVGTLLDVNVGSVLLVTGDWKIDPKYGRQFVAASWEETLPATVYGIEKYLGSGLIKGVGPKYCIKTEMPADKHFIDIYLGCTAATEFADAADRQEDGCTSAGYEVWREFIADYIAVCLDPKGFEHSLGSSAFYVSDMLDGVKNGSI